MKTFKSIPDLEQLRSHPLHDTVESLVVQVIQSYTEYRVVGFDLDMPWRLSEVPFALRTPHEARSILQKAASTLALSTKYQHQIRRKIYRFS
jgi:hypothetical protein